MSMTREEAIKHAKSKKMMLESLIYNDDCKYGNYAMYSTELSFVNVVIFALRSPTREQMEKVWRGEWEMVAESAWGKQYKCSKCRTRNSAYSHFCPACGAPLTDEAVEIVMERLEALGDEVRDVRENI